MNLFSIIKIQLKEQVDQKLFFYYEIDSLKMNEDTSGIVEIYIQVFEDLPDDIPEYMHYVIQLFHKDQIQVIRASDEPLIFSDCIDFFGLAAAGHLIKYYQQYNEIPESYISV